jgi:hypothetical protein
MYTPIIQPSDLNSVLYPEIQNEISRNDGGANAIEAIATAIQEVKMYITRYDIVQLFGNEETNVAATFTDVFLTRMVKNIAIWHFIQLANVNVNYESQKLLYEQAIDTLKRIQKGLADPKWPYLDTTGETTPPSDQVTIRRNPLRNTYGY